MSKDNLDLGRDLQRGDIVDRETFPLDDSAVEQHVCCHICMEYANGWLNDIKPLTRGTGVFTGRVRCDEDAPVYVCLEHMPCVHRQFEAFSPEVEKMLIEKQQARRQSELVE